MSTFLKSWHKSNSFYHYRGMSWPRFYVHRQQIIKQNGTLQPLNFSRPWLNQLDPLRLRNSRGYGGQLGQRVTRMGQHNGVSLAIL